jgi:hypothetical protein
MYKLEKVLYGHNYEVTFGIDIFEDCTDIEAFKCCLKTNILTPNRNCHSSKNDNF